MSGIKAGMEAVMVADDKLGQYILIAFCCYVHIWLLIDRSNDVVHRFVIRRWCETECISGNVLP